MLKTIDLSNKETISNSVMASPLPSRETVVKSGFATTETTSAGTKGVLELTVLVGNSKISSGSKIYVGSDMYNSPWANIFYKIGENRFILVPEASILFVELNKNA